MKKKVFHILLSIVMTATLLTGCKSKNADDLPQPVITPRQSELLKALDVMPEDITSVTIQDDHFEEHVLTDPVEWSFLYTYDSAEEVYLPGVSYEDVEPRIASFTTAPDSQYVSLNTETDDIYFHVSANGEILYIHSYTSEDGNLMYDPIIFRSFEYPLNTARWESLIRQHGGTVETAHNRVRGLLRYMRIWPDDIDSIEITDMDVHSDFPVYVSEVSKDWKFLSTYTEEQNSSELYHEFLIYPTSGIITVNAGDVSAILRALPSGEIMPFERLNEKTGDRMIVWRRVFTSSTPFDSKAQMQLLDSAKSQGPPLEEK